MGVRPAEAFGEAQVSPWMPSLRSRSGCFGGVGKARRIKIVITFKFLKGESELFFIGKLDKITRSPNVVKSDTKQKTKHVLGFLLP